jgi:hypothetical protein
LGLIKVRLTLGWLLISVCSEVARGDGGTLRLSRSEGNYQISVFTAPTPFRAGPVDISILVQNAATREVIQEASVTMWLALRNRPGDTMCHTATDKAATNKLLKAAVFELPEAGFWQVKVCIDGGQGTAYVRFDLEAAQRIQRWPAIWPWVSWPAPVILLFSIHKLLVWRKHRQLA